MAGSGRLTTHVLDTMHGKPARGMRLDLLMVHGDHTHHIARPAYTNADGRVDQPLLDGERFQPWASSSCIFHVGQYFERLGRRARDTSSSTWCRSASGSPRRRTTTCRCWSRPSPTRPIGAADDRWPDALRFILNDEDVALTDARADDDAARFPAARQAAARQQGRLRRGRLRRLHGAGRPAERRRARLRDGQLPASASSARCTARMWSRSSICAASGAAASGAAGDGRLPRQPVRLLHAGLRDVALWPLAARAASRAGRRSRRRCRAISAAAPAMRRSSAPGKAMLELRPTRRAIRWSGRARSRSRRGSRRSATATRVEIGEGSGAASSCPASLDDFAAIYAANPDATIVDGATDVGLWVTKFMRDIGPLIFIGHLQELHAHRRRATAR